MSFFVGLAQGFLDARGERIKQERDDLQNREKYVREALLRASSESRAAKQQAANYNAYYNAAIQQGAPDYIAHQHAINPEKFTLDNVITNVKNLKLAQQTSKPIEPTALTSQTDQALANTQPQGEMQPIQGSWQPGQTPNIAAGTPRTDPNANTRKLDQYGVQYPQYRPQTFVEALLGRLPESTKVGSIYERIAAERGVTPQQVQLDYENALMGGNIFEPPQPPMPNGAPPLTMVTEQQAFGQTQQFMNQFSIGMKPEDIPKAQAAAYDAFMYGDAAKRQEAYDYYSPEIEKANRQSGSTSNAEAGYWTQASLNDELMAYIQPYFSGDIGFEMGKPFVRDKAPNSDLIGRIVYESTQDIFNNPKYDGHKIDARVGIDTVMNKFKQLAPKEYERAMKTVGTGANPAANPKPETETPIQALDKLTKDDTATQEDFDALLAKHPELEKEAIKRGLIPPPKEKEKPQYPGVPAF